MVTRSTQTTFDVLDGEVLDGDTKDPNNVRGVSLQRHLGKLKWPKINNIVNDAQFGFNSSSSTTDAIVSLHSTTANALAEKGRLYCTFCVVYFSKAFDLVTRTNLRYKLSKVGIRSPYKNVKSRVTLNGKQIYSPVILV